MTPLLMLLLLLLLLLLLHCNGGGFDCVRGCGDGGRGSGRVRVR